MDSQIVTEDASYLWVGDRGWYIESLKRTVNVTGGTLIDCKYSPSRPQILFPATPGRTWNFNECSGAFSSRVLRSAHVVIDGRMYDTVVVERRAGQTTVTSWFAPRLGVDIREFQVSHTSDGDSPTAATELKKIDL